MTEDINDIPLDENSELIDDLPSDVGPNSQADEVIPRGPVMIQLNDYHGMVSAYQHFLDNPTNEALDALNLAIHELPEGASVRDLDTAQAFYELYGEKILYEPQQVMSTTGSSVGRFSRDELLGAVDPQTIAELREPDLPTGIDQTIMLSLKDLPGSDRIIHDEELTSHELATDSHKIEFYEQTQAVILSELHQKNADTIISDANRSVELTKMTIALLQQPTTGDAIKELVAKAEPGATAPSIAIEESKVEIFLNNALPELDDKALSFQEVTKMMSDLGIKSAPLLNVANGIMERALTTDKNLLSNTHAKEMGEHVREFVKNHLEQNKALLAFKMMTEMSKEFVERLQSDKQMFSDTHQINMQVSLQNFIRGATPIVGRLTDGFISLFGAKSH